MAHYTESTPLLSDPEALRKRAEEDGYLHFSELVPKEDLAAVRRDIMAILEEYGWLDPGTDPFDGLTQQKPRIEGTEEFYEVYDKVQKLESFHALAHHPKILGALREVFNEQPLLHPRNIARLIFPNATEHSTPAHQDYVHIQGTENVWTCWMPLGDCPVELGGLAILPASHRAGLHPVVRSLGAGSVGIPEKYTPGEWHIGPLKAGSVLMFHSLTVHKGMPNLTGNRMRVSVDYRYQPISQEVTRESFGVHMGRQQWDEIYEGWSNKDIQYYWRDLDLKFVDFKQDYYKFEDQPGEPAAKY